MRADGVETFTHVLTAARSGEGWAFESMYNSMAQSITAFATVRGAEDPEAITNDTFLKAFTGLPSFEGGEADFRSWVFSIARNNLIDAHRRRSRRPRISNGHQMPEPSVESAEVVALESMSVDNVTAILACLTDEQREVISLRLVADLSLKQVADIVGKPITAVKALQRRGIQRLQKEISGKVVS